MAKQATVFPEGSVFGTWFPVKEGPNWRIKRMVTLPDGKRKPQRLDRSTYSNQANTLEAMTLHCDRLNYGVNMSKQREIEIESAFLPPKLITGFHEELLAAFPSNKQYADFLFKRATKEYFLDFFVNFMKLPDPNTWAKNQTSWGLALTGGNLHHKIFETRASSRTIKLVIQIANRFLRYLHQQRPDQYPLIKLTPISKSVLKQYAAEHDETDIGQYVKDEDWVKIQEKLPSDIKPFIHLMYYYGLRRSESLGFQSVDAVRNAYLNVTHQLKSVTPEPVFGPLKSREQRKTPHWFCSVDEAFEMVTQSLTKKMHPDTLDQRWNEYMRGLGMDYKLHDFRRTFITKALRTQNPRDVQLAVGHVDLRTTMRYAQDDRTLGDEVFRPKPKSVAS